MKDDELATAVREFFEYLDKTDETESGKIFHPVGITCCRALWTKPLGEVMERMRDLSGYGGKA